ncbi:MAG: ATP-binding protein [Holosporaceae bacterium]|jgi:anti-sigma regulatory factor (Ser/Thr protein kinase)|nr:ATP-binding protein [Holosporaceae bacterium]
MLFEIKNKIDEITYLCDTVKAYCNSNDISDEKYHDIVLILDEMVTNIIMYAYPDGGEHVFSVEIEKTNDSYVNITITDNGIAFDPLAKDDPITSLDIEEREIGGLGIFLVKQLSECIEYSRIDDHNKLNIKVAIVKKEENHGSQERK